MYPNNFVNMNFNKRTYKVPRRAHRRKPILTAILVVIIMLVYVLNTTFTGLMDFLTSQGSESNPPNDGLVHTTIPIQIVPDIAPEFHLTELKFPAVKNSIFFIKTSETGDLSSRQACSIESAASTNPDRNISVIFIEPIPRILKFANLAIYITRNYNNIVFYRAPVSMFIEKTPLEDKDEDTWPTIKEKALKYLSFYNFGGTYLELDMIVTRSFASLPRNWVVKENNEALAIGAMSVTHVESGRLFSMIAANEVWENLCPKNWTRKIVRVITRAMKKFCMTQDVTKMSAATCRGIEVLESNSFYPISHWPHLFQPGEVWNQPYAYHFWDDLSKTSFVGRKTLFDKLASKFCPNVYYYFLRTIF